MIGTLGALIQAAASRGHAFILGCNNLSISPRRPEITRHGTSCYLALGRCQVACRTPAKVRLDPADDFIGGNHLHAARQVAAPPAIVMLPPGAPGLAFSAAKIHHIDAQGLILLIRIPQGNSPALPAATLVATEQGSVRVDELMMGIRFPLRRFPTTGDDHAGSILWLPSLHFDRCGEVH